MKSIVTRKEIKKTIETILLDHKFIAPGTEVHEPIHTRTTTEWAGSTG